MKRLVQITGTALLLSIAAVASPAEAGAGHRGRGPDGSFQVRMGGFFPEGGGDFWDETESAFTLDASDLNDFAFGLTVTRGISDVVEIGLNADFYDATSISAYRDFVDGAGFPILHDTTLETLPLTLDVRLLAGGRYRQRGGGRQVLRPVFYLGGGFGVTFWQYEEVGDFIDFADPQMAVFPGFFEDNGAAFETHVLAGFELPLNPSFNVLLEGRYSWADDELGGDFGGLGKIELGGPSVFVGGAWRF